MMLSTKTVRAIDEPVRGVRRKEQMIPPQSKEANVAKHERLERLP